MKKTVIICATVFLTLICSISLIGFLFISQQNRIDKNNNLKIKNLEQQISKYEKCVKKSNKINVKNLSGAVLVDDEITMYQISAYKVEEIKELQNCLNKIYND